MLGSFEFDSDAFLRPKFHTNFEEFSDCALGCFPGIERKASNSSEFGVVVGQLSIVRPTRKNQQQIGSMLLGCKVLRIAQIIADVERHELRPAHQPIP